MFGIPEWALGVAAIMAVLSVLKIVQARLMPRGYRPRSMREMMGGEMPAETIAEVDELKRRVGELEERVDFAERLLARQREQERLQP